MTKKCVGGLLHVASILEVQNIKKNMILTIFQVANLAQSGKFSMIRVAEIIGQGSCQEEMNTYKEY